LIFLFTGFACIAQTPYISCVSAFAGSTNLQIQGGNFTGATSVTISGFAGTVSSFAVNGSSFISVILSTYINPGPIYNITVTTPKGTSNIYFAVSVIPIISSISPSSVGPGDTLVVNISSTGGGSSGLYQLTNSTCGSFSSSMIYSSFNQVKFLISNGCQGISSNYNIQMSTIGNCMINMVPVTGLTFNATPIINSISPATAKTGDTVTITGKYLYTNSVVSTVSFGGVAASQVISVSENTIKAIVGNGASGNVSVTNSFGVTGTISGFIYVSPLPPTITSFSPTSQYVGGTVTIKGIHFSGASSVKLGSTPASSFTVVSDTVITAVVGTAISSDTVFVTTFGGTAFMRGFSILAPTISSFSPTAQSTGNAVIITGNNLNGTTSVKFGGIAASSFTIISNTSISAVVNSTGASGTISVTTPGGTASISGFTIAQPIINSFTPAAQYIGGTVICNGSHFNGASAVKFGGIAAASFTIISDTVISAVVGSAGAAGSVSITTLGGTGTLGGFSIAAPTITSFTPDSQYIGGTITITGTNFNGASSVKLGGIPDSLFTVVSNTTITVIVRANSLSGAISVTTLGGTATTNGFYIAQPIITSFTPNNQLTGDTVTITGNNFSAATAVSFGGTPASFFRVVSNTSIKAVVGIGTSGNISVTTPGGSAILSGFIYIPPPPAIASFTPTSSVTGGLITITGTNFSGASAVSFGGLAASSFTVVSANTITAIVGTGNSGSVSVTTTGGTGNDTGFTYIPPPPIIKYFAPTSQTIGGTITISGNYFTGATSVKIGSIAAHSFTIVNDSTITAIVDSTNNGSITVLTPSGTISAVGFRVISAPSIHSFYPTSGPIGSTVTIIGNNFSPTAGNNMVIFGAVKAVVSYTSADTLKVVVPACASYQPITVTTNNNLMAASRIPFIVTFPGGNINANSFPTRMNFPLSSTCYAVTYGDLDGDGKPDIIVTKVDTVAIFRNISTTDSILLAPEIDIPVLNSRADVGDINGDGKLDIICISGSTVTILNNSSTVGNISFQQAIALNLANPVTKSALGDMDLDGKMDLLLMNSTGVTILKNTGVGGSFSFAPPVYVTYKTVNTLENPSSFCVSDLDGDGRPDVIISNKGILYSTGFPTGTSALSIFKNTSTPFAISFAPEIKYGIPGEYRGVAAGNFHGDSIPDLAFSNTGIYQQNVINNIDNVGTQMTVLQNQNDSILLGTSSLKNINCMEYPDNVSVGNLNGDNLPDIFLGQYLLGSGLFLQNTSSANAISFSAVNINNTTNISIPIIADIDGDGKSDIIGFMNNSFSIVKNNVGSDNSICVGGDTSLISNLTGPNYQWQVNTGLGGFTNLVSDSIYSGVNSDTLSIRNIPSGLYGYQYQCIVGGSASYISTFKIGNTYTGATDQHWETASNWSCGVVPDANTDVIINNATVLISTNAICRSLLASPGSTVTVNANAKLTITH